MKGVFDAGMLSLLKLTPGIIWKQSGVVHQIVSPSDWVRLLTMQDPMTAVNASQWIQVHKGPYKGDLGFVTHVETWSTQVLVIPHLKTATLQTATLKRKRTTIRPERLFEPNIFKSVYQWELKLQDNGTYTSRGLVFDHGLLLQTFDLHSISPAPVAIPTHILWLFDRSSHPTLTFFNIPHPKEWTFEEGEQVVVNSSNKEATIAAVKDTNLEVDLDTKEGMVIASWHNVSKVFAIGDFVTVMSGPSQGTMGWFQGIEEKIAYLLEYNEKDNISNDNTKVSSIIIWVNI
jgi:ribosomal protein L24